MSNLEELGAWGIISGIIAIIAGFVVYFTFVFL